VIGRLPPTIHRLGLKWAIFSSFTLALLIILGALYFIVPKQVEIYLLHRLEQRADAVAREVKRRINFRGGTEFNDAASRTMTEVAEAEKDVRRILLVSPDGQVIAKTYGGDVREVESIIEQFNAANHPVRMQLRNGDLLVSSQVFASSGQGTGYLLVEMERESVDQVLSELRKTVLVALLIGCVLFVGLVWLISRVFILRPLNSMMLLASRLSEADLTGRVESASPDELGQLAEALNRIGDGLRTTLGRVRGVAEGVAQVIEQISRTGNAVSEGAVTVFSRVEETSNLMAAALDSLRGIAANAEALNHNAQASSSSVAAMAKTNEEVADNIQAMASSVGETTSAIEEMTFTIKEVAKNIENLTASMEQTSSSMREIDISINQVEVNATETAKLSEQVSSDAERGVESLQKTLTGIDKIKESSRTAAEVIENLRKRISEIGNIVDVIDEVADQTNLLALNAAIIAAQAGEHGKGFAVVAEEIKDLAERTGASTKEISELIEGVQGESRNAVAAMDQGVRNVDEGVRLGREAESALKKIFESANKSTAMVKAIARASVEQSRGSKQVTSAVQKIAETVQEISRASSEQARGSEQIINSAQRMKALTSNVQSSGQAQAQASNQITQALERINEMVNHLSKAQKEQTKGSDQVLRAVQAIKTVADQQTKSVQQLEQAIETLQKQAEVLRGEVRRFRV